MNGLSAKEAFLNEEIRNDFVVTEERKKLWTVILDLFLEFKSVCEKYHLTYYPCYGFLLGAVRHNGFIPWDDDLDVCMPRKDYMKFVDLCHEFTAPYFLQTPETDKGYFYGMAKIRNSNTTAVTEMFRYQGFNHGIWLSVFPLDNWKLEEGEDGFAQIKKLLVDCSTYMRKTNPNLSEKDIQRVKEYGDTDPWNTYNMFQKLTTQYNGDNTDYSLIPCSVYPYRKNVYLAEDFQEVLTCKFEHIEIPIPKGYDRILRTIYHDYHQFPPLEERGRWHPGITFDTDRPYDDYLKQA